jgi:hypothetical protein
MFICRSFEAKGQWGGLVRSTEELIEGVIL